MSNNPWTAAPGELPGDPENDPANWGQCDCCGKIFHVDDLLFIPYDRNNSHLDTLACPKCRGAFDEPEYEYEDRLEDKPDIPEGPDETHK